MSLRDAALAVLIMALWGLNFPLAKLGIAEIPPMLLVAIRWVLVAVLLAPFFRPPPGQWVGLWVLSLLLGVVHFALMFTGLRHVDGSLAAIAVQIQVPFAALLAALFFGDRLGWRRALGMAIAIAGVAVLAGSPRAQSALWAVGLIIAAAFAWALANIQAKRLSEINAFAINGWMAVLAAPQMLVASLVFEEGHLEALATASWVAWFSIAYQTVFVVILGYGLWYWLFRRHDVNTMMPFTLLAPLFGMISSIVILGEPFTWTLILGAALTIGGVAIIVIRRPRLVDPGAQTS